ncbi:DUF924 family protein [Catenovulum adriaticum]|uniref:DUF924 domain-containing protein n=1 Tax=Catenovulum adriaticum TaxID=2984846 RepID=A0ABY7AMD8_9ALTE|nr:DUF924 family protein [Catenovulum sp. TS8]WAJ70470.1 DUF924 domain-containing protein [Catenovulum sp. TS8]
MYMDVIKFWFEEINQSSWFAKSDEFDLQLKKRFLALHDRAVNCELYQWRDSALGCLAEIIVLDQFSRNIYRDKPQSFAYDSLALALAQSAINRGFDNELTPEQRSFMYMPYMHSESPFIHKVAVELYTKLGIEKNLHFELKHKAIIDRFGRYPHRNKILGRVSAPEEQSFLKTPDSGF